MLPSAASRTTLSFQTKPSSAVRTPGSSGPTCRSLRRAGAKISPSGATSTAWCVSNGTRQIRREQRSILTIPAPSKFITTLPSGSSAAP